MQWATASTCSLPVCLADYPDRGRVVVDRGSVERVVAGRQVDRRTPVLDPDVVPSGHQSVDQAGRGGRVVEAVGPHRQPADEHYGNAVGPRRSVVAGAYVVEVDLAAVARFEGQDAPLERRASGQLVPFPADPSLQRRTSGRDGGEGELRFGQDRTAVHREQPTHERRLIEDRCAEAPARAAAHPETGAQKAQRAYAKHPGGHGARVVVLLGHVRDVPGEQAHQQPRAVAPGIVVGIVLDQLEAAEGERAARAIAQEEAVEHAPAARIRSAHEEVEAAVVGLEPPAEGRTMDRAREPGRALRPVQEAVQVVDCDRDVGRAACALAAAGDHGRVVVARVEGDRPAHVLAETQVWSRSRHHARPERPSRIPSATRSAKAAIVKLGLTPTGPGIAAPSAT